MTAELLEQLASHLHSTEPYPEGDPRFGESHAFTHGWNAGIRTALRVVEQHIELDARPKQALVSQDWPGAHELDGAAEEPR